MELNWGMSDEIITAGTISTNNSNGEPLTVEVVDNHCYFYSRVNSDRCLDLMKKLRNLDKDLRNEHISRELDKLPDDHLPTPIWLHIQSPGGHSFAGLAVMEQIKRINSPVYSVVEGYCASAGTFISMACDRRYIQPSAFMLIHQIKSTAWGTYDQIKDEAHLLDMCMEKIAKFYKDHSEMEEGKIRELLKRDSWFSAGECIDLGLADEIL